MRTEDLVKAVMQRIQESSQDARKDLMDFRAEVRTDIREVRDKISSIDSTQTRQQATLEEHIRRTEVNEKALELMKTMHYDDIGKVKAKIEPLERHVAMWGGVGKAIAVLGVLASIVVAVLKLVK